MRNFSRRQKQFLYAALCLLWAGYNTVDFSITQLATYRQQSKELRQMTDIKKRELAKIITKNQARDSLEIEIQRANREFDKLQEMFPDRDIIPKRLRDINKASQNSTALPLAFKPVHTQERDFYRENLYEVVLRTGYHDLGNFFQEIANLPYPTAIIQVAISQSPSLARGDTSRHNRTGNIHTTRTQFVLKTFTAK